MLSIWSRYHISISIGLITFVVIAIYGQTAWFDLVTYDDPHFILLNETVQKGLNKETFVWSFTTTKLDIWHPVTWLSYLLETTLFGGDNHAARHVINLSLHLLNSLLVWMSMRLFGLKKLTALFIALFWAAHPQHVQVVAWVSERKELLATFFGLSALCFYVQWWRDQKKIKYALSLIAFMLALGSKPTIVPLSLFILYYSYNHVQRGSIKRSLLAAIPFLVFAIAISVLTVKIKTQGNLEAVLSNDQYMMDIGLWLALIPTSLAHYLSAFVWPWPLPVMIHTPDAINTIDFVKDILIIGVFLCISSYLLLRCKMARFGLLWFLLFWLPVSGIISLGAFYVADRYMYLPHIGLIMLSSELIKLFVSRNE